MDKKIINHFKKSDPVLYKELQKILANDIQFNLARNNLTTNNYFIELVESIINQQLSGKAASTIFSRFKNLFLNNKITPKKILKLDDQKIRNVGVSFSKIKYIKDLSDKVKNKELNLENIDKLTNSEILECLVKVKGIGPWTAEMFLMFSLNRPDIFSHGDLGLKNAIKKLYKLDSPTKEEIELICNKWSPYKTYACRILWKSLDD